MARKQRPFKAWVVTVDSAAWGEYALALLPPLAGEKQIGEYLKQVHALTCLNLAEQAAMFRTRPAWVPADVHRGSAVHLYLIAEETISAHRSTVLEVLTQEGRSSVRYKPDAYHRWALDPNTGQPVSTAVVDPRERTLDRIDLNLTRLLPRTPDGVPLYRAKSNT